MNKSRRSQPDFECLHCGEMLPGGSHFCRHCGADASVGWNHDDSAEPDYGQDDFEYDDYIAREFPEHLDPDAPAMAGRKFVAWVILALVISMIIGAMPFFF
ncbi:MAG: zinc ribbon domain-containing protein [Planctomycetaceae bacterium]